jgi:nucleotide-binding universal stress UspA family protein
VFKKILVCLDGSELAEQILPFAVEQALCFDSQLVLLRVFTEPGFIGLAVPGFPGIPVEARAVEKQIQQEENEAREYLKVIADRLLSEKGVKAEYVSTYGVAGETIVKYASENEIELLALATHGRSGPGRVIMGSVADYVLRHLHLPVLIVRPVETRSKKQ